MEIVGAQVYNMGSVGFVSRESPCLCDFPAIGRLNGVQEVGGSNPLAPTSQGSPQQEVVASLFHFRTTGRKQECLFSAFCPCCPLAEIVLPAILKCRKRDEGEWLGKALSSPPSAPL